MDFSKALLSWYSKNARSLPWRQNNDPYFIWISEIILQQTRVDQGLPYYLEFVKAFPNIKKLHQASEDQVLKKWQGLGYYSRARNMKKAAVQIVEEHNGIFPQTYEGILSLQGIGPYTAAAISSISFNLARAVVDGNVYRVLARYFGVSLPINSTEGKKYFQKLADELIDPDHPGTHNQAIMEFGARLCKPQNPDCGACPLVNSCIAFAQLQVKELPVKLKKLKVNKRYLNFLLLHNGDEVWIEKREEQNIWKGLYQLPLIESDKELEAQDLVKQEAFINLIKNQPFQILSVNKIKHKLTHRDLYIQFLQLELEGAPSLPFIRLELSKLNEFAFPKPIENYLKALKILTY